jgi:ribosomal protein S18 acetylase RimI-like enzyme
MTEVVLPLTIRDLTRGDLPSCRWSGSALHVAGLARELDRAEAGEVEYLAVCLPAGSPVALGGIDYTLSAGAGTLYQLSVYGPLQSCGIGTALIGAAEERIRARGLRRAELVVEETNTRARMLYERLGYAAYDSELAGWDEVAADGSVFRYETMCALMRKELL